MDSEDLTLHVEIWEYTKNYPSIKNPNRLFEQIRLKEIATRGRLSDEKLKLYP